jgi:regulator of sigma E protease
MTTLLAFLFALTLLIAIHEYGHYRVAVACGVKVLRFSIGFGPVILRHQRTPQSTEFVLSAVPLGGYVRMLDEREGEVAPEDRAMAFNNRPLAARVAIVAAGPLANLLLAVALYAAVNWVGLSQPAAVLAPPVAGSVAEQAGLRGRETVHSVERDGQVRPVETLEGLRWEIVNGVLEGQDLILSARDGQGVERQFRLRTSTIDSKDVSPDLVRQVGITGPWTEPVVGQIRTFWLGPG